MASVALKQTNVFSCPEVVFWWWWIFWIIVTDYGVTQSRILKEPLRGWRSLWEVGSAKLLLTAVLWPLAGHSRINTRLTLLHTNNCLFIQILCGWCVIMDVCHVIWFSLKCEYTNNHCSTKWYCNKRFLLPMMSFDRTVWKSFSVRQQKGTFLACWKHFSNLLLSVTGELMIALSWMFCVTQKCQSWSGGLVCEAEYTCAFQDITTDATASNRWPKALRLIQGTTVSCGSNWVENFFLFYLKVQKNCRQCADGIPEFFIWSLIYWMSSSSSADYWVMWYFTKSINGKFFFLNGPLISRQSCGAVQVCEKMGFCFMWPEAAKGPSLRNAFICYGNTIPSSICGRGTAGTST